MSDAFEDEDYVTVSRSEHYPATVTHLLDPHCYPDLNGLCLDQIVAKQPEPKPYASHMPLRSRHVNKLRKQRAELRDQRTLQDSQAKAPYQRREPPHLIKPSITEKERLA